MNYRDIEIEKYWDIPTKDPRKKEKIKTAINTDRYIASIKKDGEYIRAIYDTDGEVWIIGRGTNAKEMHNLNKHLVFITQWIITYFKPGTCIIGELYVPGETSRAIRKYTGSLVSKSLKEQEECPPKFYIHDIWAFDGKNLMDTKYEERIKYLSYINIHMPHDSRIEFAKYVSGPDTIVDYIAEALENGEEGCVLVSKDSIVTPGKRTAWKTIKVKKEFANPIDCFFTGNYRLPTKDYDGKEIENWEYWYNLKTGEKYLGKFYKNYLAGEALEPVTKLFYLGLPGSLEVGVFKNGLIFSLCYISGLTDELKTQFVKDRSSIIMKPITITGMMATDNSIRHPKFLDFREDILLEDCNYEKIFGE